MANRIIRRFLAIIPPQPDRLTLTKMATVALFSFGIATVTMCITNQEKLDALCRSCFLRSSMYYAASSVSHLPEMLCFLAVLYADHLLKKPTAGLVDSAVSSAPIFQNRREIEAENELPRRYDPEETVLSPKRDDTHKEYEKVDFYSRDLDNKSETFPVCVSLRRHDKDDGQMASTRKPLSCKPPAREKARDVLESRPPDIRRIRFRVQELSLARAKTDLRPCQPDGRVATLPSHHQARLILGAGDMIPGSSASTRWAPLTGTRVRPLPANQARAGAQVANLAGHQSNLWLRWVLRRAKLRRVIVITYLLGPSLAWLVAGVIAVVPTRTITTRHLVTWVALKEYWTWTTIPSVSGAVTEKDVPEGDDSARQ